MSKTRLFVSAAASASLAAMILLTGCGSGSDNKTGGTGADKGTTPVAEQKADKPDANQPKTADSAALTAAVGKAVIGASDVGHGVKAQDTDTSLKAPTNDICGKSWPTNSERIARRQGYFWKPSQVAPLVVSNEAVAYQQGKGSAALSEVEKAIASCNSWKHAQGTMEQIHIVEPPSGTLDDAFAWEGIDTRKGTDYHYLAVYQTKGDLMSAVYVWDRDRNEMQQVGADVSEQVAKKLQAAIR